jgi:hypothetical protein
LTVKTTFGLASINPALELPPAERDDDNFDDSAFA